MPQDYDYLPTLQPKSYRGQDMKVYTEYPRTGKRGQLSGSMIRLERKTEDMDSQLRFVKKLCTLGNLQFLGIFDTWFEFHKDPGQQTAKGERTNIAWLHQLTFDYDERAALERALFHDGPL